MELQGLRSSESVEEGREAPSLYSFSILRQPIPRMYITQ